MQAMLHFMVNCLKAVSLTHSMKWATVAVVREKGDHDLDVPQSFHQLRWKGREGKAVGGLDLL
jgi:hypothetical protein